MNNEDLFDQVPLDTPIYIIDDMHNLYVGTISKNTRGICRGKCLEGNAENFYHRGMITWGYLPIEKARLYTKETNMNEIEKKVDLERAQRVTSQTLYNDAINFSWFYHYLDARYPEGTKCNGYNALVEMFVNYHRALERQKQNSKN